MLKDDHAELIRLRVHSIAHIKIPKTKKERHRLELLLRGGKKKRGGKKRVS